jgi:hypothetical protein
MPPRKAPRVLLEDDDGDETLESHRIEFDVVDGPSMPPAPRVDEDEYEFCANDNEDDEDVEFCVLCSFSGADQTDPRLQYIVSQIENKVKLTSGMGMKQKVRDIRLVYTKTLLPLLPADTPEWTIQSVSRHIRGMHGTSSTATLKQIDVSSIGRYMCALDQFALKRRKATGEIVGVNEAVCKLRINLSMHVQRNLSDKA